MAERSLWRRNRSVPQRGLALFLAVSMMAAGNVFAAKAKTYVFRGKIQNVSSAARTFTLLSDKNRYVFHVTPETRIEHEGVARKFSDLWRGQNAEVTMKVGPAGEGIALSVKLVHVGDAIMLSVLAATTPGGKTLSAEEVKPLIVHHEWDSGVASIYWHWKLGVFLLSVRSDGTVAEVEKLQSTGHRVLDVRIADAFKKWRFRPNSVREVRVPAYYVWRRWR